MSEETIFQIVREFGFPIFVILWFMFRTEKILKANTDILEQLKDAILAKKSL